MAIPDTEYQGMPENSTPCTHCISNILRLIFDFYHLHVHDISLTSASLYGYLRREVVIVWQEMVYIEGCDCAVQKFHDGNSRSAYRLL